MKRENRPHVSKRRGKSLILTLFDKGKVFNLILPERVTGRYILSSEDKDDMPFDLMAVEEENGDWYLKSNKYAFLLSAAQEKATKMKLEPFGAYTIYKGDHQSKALLYVEPQSKEGNLFSKHHVISNQINIGRSRENQICFSNKLVSSSHCTIEYLSHNEAVIKDHNSSNGTYVNGEKITEEKLSIGDVIYIMGLKIIYNGRMLSLNNPHRHLLLDQSAFSPFTVDEPIVEVEEELDDLIKEEENTNLFYRSPRFKRDIQTSQISIDPPPQMPNMEETPLMLMLGPSITMGMSSLFMAFFALMNVMNNNGNMMMAIPMLVMSVTMLTGMILWPILTKRYERKRREKQERIRQEKYFAYLTDMKQVIENECLYQSEILHENHVSLENCLARIKGRERNLWERSLSQDDFLKLRLGLGNIPLNANIRYPEKKFSLEDDHLKDELYRLVETPHILESVPVTFSLIEERISGIIGHRHSVIDFVKGLIFQLASLHSYDELKLVFLYDQNEQEQWKFVKWLPHVWNDERNMRFIATDENELKELSSYLEKEIFNRTGQNEEGRKEVTTHFVVFSMNKSLAGKTEFVNTILEQKRNIGFSLVTLYDELKNLPKECTQVIELGETSKIYDKDDISGNFIAFQPDIDFHDDADELAIQLANIYLDTSENAYKLPEMLTFMEMFGISKIEHLNALTRWKENNPTTTIQTPIGVGTSGELFKIDLHEKYHGPHGLIAGMTGSGKSEFIMTFILSLAVNYHPDEVAFILIDYKGGGMANAFLNLPHLAGTITNLDGAAVNRSLISIQSELKRRQAIFSETSKRIDESNIDIYKYQKLYREGVVTEPLQHLFIISDEFAELKTQQPEFMEQLVSAARIGRSLGIHLILATQKPSGVVDDQIWSNSKFRISLKVQEKADSMEVIKRPDAAELSTTGRFYLQVGFNELFELGQSAWAGAPYYPTDKVEKGKDESIAVIDHLGRVVKSARIDKRRSLDKNPPKQIDEITKYLADLAKQEGIKVKPLWLEPIPAMINLDKLKEKYRVGSTEKFLLNPVIGELDNPAKQSQEILRMPISKEGNAIIYGAAGSGKTTFLTTLIYSLMEDHTPEELNLYLLDFSTETLSWYRNAPHVGDVMLSDDREKIANLFKRLGSEIAKRKKLLSQYGGDFFTYNRMADEKLPSMVVVIHNYSAFSEMYEEIEESIAYLTREGTKYGIYFILTAINTVSIRFRLLQNFKQLFVLQLNDSSDYSGVLGNVNGTYPSKYKGRGIIKTDGVYEFQVAHITERVSNQFELITEYCQQYAQHWNGKAARRIPILPEKVDLTYLQSQGDFNDRNIVPIGVDKQSLQLTEVDFRENFINLVLASSSEQCTPFLQGLSEVLAAKADSELIVIDTNQHFVLDNSKNYQYCSKKDQIEEMIVYLFNTLVYRNNTTKDALAEGKTPPVFEYLTCLIDSFTDLNQSLSLDGQDKLKVFLDKGSSLNVHIIFSESVERVSSIAYEDWFKQHVSPGDGIWIGNGIADQYTLKITTRTNDMYKEIPVEFGYVVRNGKPRLVKLLTSYISKEEALIYG